ncbi:hypothetical protein S245_031271, partial [Arachis hypogaea]
FGSQRKKIREGNGINFHFYFLCKEGTIKTSSHSHNIHLWLHVHDTTPNQTHYSNHFSFTHPHSHTINHLPTLLIGAAIIQIKLSFSVRL